MNPAVVELCARYVDVVDNGPLEEWPDLFTEECSYRIISRENVERGLPLALMQCESRDMLRDRVAAIRDTAFYVSRRVRHIVGLPLARETADGFAVRGNFAVYESLVRSPSTLLCVGTYEDVIVCDEGRWRFRERHCVYDGDIVVGSIVHPI